MNKSFVLDSCITACADKKMQNDTVKKLFKNFCLGCGKLTLADGPDNTFQVGSTQLPVLPEGKEYVIHVDEKGIAIVGNSYGGLMRGFLVMLMHIDYRDEGMSIPCIRLESQYRIANRMIHICVFPDNPRHFTRKMLRLAGLCQYTHVVLEFWGMLQFDCMKELCWPMAYSKAEVAGLIKEIREMGMEPIPMFNQLGHATACRAAHGKHVVLDQNPTLQHLFTGDGWDWNIRSEQVHQLHKAIRAELYELFGAGEYFHVGCDEAYNYTYDDTTRKELLPAFLNRLTSEVAAEGRRPMIWMDMMLERGKYPGATATCDPDEVATLQSSLHESTVMVDWQYRIYEAPVQTMLSLKDSGHDVIGAPWHYDTNFTAMADTVAEYGFFGIMMTTWHTMETMMPSILGCAKRCGVTTFPWSPISSAKTFHKETAAMLRRVSFEGNTYETAGWIEKDTAELVVRK